MILEITFSIKIKSNDHDILESADKVKINDANKHFLPISENERVIVSFEFWLVIALIFGAQGQYFIIRAVSHVWF